MQRIEKHEKSKLDFAKSKDKFEAIEVTTTLDNSRREGKFDKDRQTPRFWYPYLSFGTHAGF